MRTILITAAAVLVLAGCKKVEPGVAYCRFDNGVEATLRATDYEMINGNLRVYTRGTNRSWNQEQSWLDVKPASQCRYVRDDSLPPSDRE